MFRAFTRNKQKQRTRFLSCEFSKTLHRNTYLHLPASLCPRPSPSTLTSFLKTDRQALATVPVQKDRFEEVLTRLHIPDAFLDILVRPRGIFKKKKSYVEDQRCEGK